MERLDHLLELAHLAAAVVGRGVLGVRREEAVGVIAPVVAEAFVEQAGLVHELVHRHQLDGGDALLADRLEHGRRGEARVGAAQVLGHGRMQPGEALHVQLVDHRGLGPVARTPVAAPVERRIDDVGARRVGGAVGLLDRVLVAAERIGEHRVAPRDVAREGLGVRVGQQLGRVAAQPVRRVVRAMHAIAVGLSGGDPGQEQVPDEAGLTDEVVPGFLAGLVEEAQLDTVRQAREHAEMHALPGQRGPERAVDRRHPVLRSRSATGKASNSASRSTAPPSIVTSASTWSQRPSGRRTCVSAHCGAQVRIGTTTATSPPRRKPTARAAAAPRTSSGA